MHLIFCLEFLKFSLLHDRKIFNHLNPEEFQPEPYLKDGKLNPDVKDPDCAAFWFGRRSVNVTIYSLTYISGSFNLILPQYMSW